MPLPDVVSGLLLSVGPEVQILSGTPANNAESLCFSGLSAFLIGKHEKSSFAVMHGCKPCKGCYLPLPGNKKAPYCYGASVCQKASTLLYRECRGEHCSPAAISGNVRFHGSIWNAPLRRRGGFYIRPCNLGQRKTSRASTARPYNALFRQAEAPYCYGAFLLLER